VTRIVVDPEPQPEVRIAKLLCADLEKSEEADQRHAPLRVGEIPGGEPGATKDCVRLRAAYAQIVVQAVHETCEVDRRHGG
jgi:hypothetical protein